MAEQLILPFNYPDRRFILVTPKGLVEGSPNKNGLSHRIFRLTLRPRLR